MKEKDVRYTKSSEEIQNNLITEIETNFLTKGEHICPSDWEKQLSLNYWKNWREKIKSFQYLDELNFYTSF